MMKRTAYLRAGSAMVAVMLGSLANVAAAQDQAQEPSTQQGSTLDEPTEAPRRSDAPAQDIIVTGTRTASGFQAPTPVTVLSDDELLRKAPTGASDALRQLPQFQSSSSPYNAAAVAVVASAGINGGNQSYGSFLNLRGLGANRVLLMQDGRRLDPTSPVGTTDSALIPQLLISRVDVVTGGVSAVYGSDAVSGVVNYVMDSRFKGLKVVAQGGIASRGDLRNYRIGAAGGLSFLDDRLHIIASAETNFNDGIHLQKDRPWTSGRPAYGASNLASPLTAGSASNPLIAYQNTGLLNTSFPGNIVSGPLAGNVIVDGTVRPFNQGTRISQTGCTDCGDNYYVFAQGATLVPKLRTTQLFTRATFDISDRLTVWAQAATATNRVFAKDGVSSPLAYTIFRENPYLPASAVAQLGATPAFGMVKAFAPPSLYPDSPYRPYSALLDSSVTTFAGGLNGSFSDSTKFEVNYGYTRAKSKTVATVPILPRLYAAVDAVRDPSGNIVCNVSITNPGLYPGCQPLNLFTSTPNQAAIDWIWQDASYTARVTTKSIDGNISTDVVTLPGGPLTIAVGASYREQSYSLTTPNPPGSFTTAGIRGYTPGSIFYSAQGGITPASGLQRVKEAYGEINIPLLADRPFFQSLSINAAGRITDYKTSGRVETWKLGAVWQPIEDIRLRATLSRDIRAPSLNELFAGASSTRQAVNDVHVGAGSLLLPVITSGNANLSPEKADDFTAGVVFTPTFARGLKVAVDYYSYKLNNAIGIPFSFLNVIQICESSGGTDPTCDLIQRPGPFSDRSPANAATAILQKPLNLSKITVSGVDFEASYPLALGNGQLNLRAIGTYLDKYEVSSAPGQPVQRFDGNADGTTAGLPKLRGTLEATFVQGNWTIGVQERIIGSLKRSILPNTVIKDNKISPIAYTDLNVSYKFPVMGTESTMFLNVSNLFDKAPPALYSNVNIGGLLTIPAVYDIVGTTFTAGVRLKL